MALTPEEQAELDQLEREEAAGTSNEVSPSMQKDDSFAQGMMRGAGWIGDGTPENPGGAYGELQAIGRSFKNAAAGISKMAGGAWDATQQAANELAANPGVGNFAGGNFPGDLALKALGNMGSKVVGSLYQGVEDPKSNLQTAKNIGSRTLRIGAESIPVVGPAIAEVGRDYFSDNLQSPSHYGEVLGKSMTELPAQATLAMAPELMGVGKGVATATKDTIVGAPQKYQTFAQLADRGAYAIPEALGAGSRNTKILSEASLLDRTAKAAPVFARENPLANVDVNAPFQIDPNNPMQGNKGWVQFENNMKGIKNNAVMESKSIIEQATNLEAQKLKEAAANQLDYTPGIKYEDISLVKNTEAGPYSIDDLATTPERAQGVQLAKDWLKEQFGIASPNSTAGLKQQAEAAAFGKEIGRPLTAQELHDTLIKVNAQLRELGRWDDTEWLQQGLNPSMKNAEVQALDFIRERLAASTGEYLKPLLGEDLTNRYLRAKENYGMVSTFEPLMDRAKRAGSEAWATQNARGQQPNSGLLQAAMSLPDQVLDSVAPGRHEAMAKMGPMGAQRTNLMLSRVKDLVEMTNNPASRPLPRGWAAIKMNAQNLANFTELGTRLGVINPMMNLAQMPDKLAQPLVAQVAQAAPEMFETNPDGLTSVVDNVIHNPMEKDLLYKDANEIKDPAARAIKMSSLFENKYTPPQMIPPKTEPVAPPIDSLGSLTSLIPDIEPQVVSPSPMDPNSNIEKLKSKVDLHNQDWIQ